MIYDSAHTIPAKLYFKIVEGASITMLTDEPDIETKTLKEVWQTIEDEYALVRDAGFNKALDLSKKIESLAAKYEAVTIAVHYLKVMKDKELLEMLIGYGYKIKWEGVSNEDYLSYLDTIAREVEAINIKIEKYRNQLPKDTGKGIPFDQCVMSYSAFTELGYIDPNVLPLMQYDALIKNGNQKMKALEKNGGKQNK